MWGDMVTSTPLASNTSSRSERSPGSYAPAWCERVYHPWAMVAEGGHVMQLGDIVEQPY